MGRHQLTDAEKGFWGLIQEEGGGSLSKRAVELEPETADALGIPSVSPAILDQLEREAKGDPAPSAGPPVEAPQQPNPAPSQAAAGDPAPSAPPPARPMPPGMPEPEQEEQPVEQVMGAEQAEPEQAAQVDAFSRLDQEPDLDDEDAAPSSPPGRSTHGRLFSDKRAHPLQILEVLEGRYGTKWADWEPATLWWGLRRDFGPIGELARNKVMALRVAVTTDTPWLDWDIFEKCGLTWNDVMPVIGEFQPMSPMQIAFTVQIMRAIRADQEFSHEINAYIAAILEENGFAYAPEEYFAGAQELINRKKWLVGLQHQVETMWAHAKDVEPTSIDWRDNNPIDIHVLKLAVVKHYLDARANQRMAPAGAPGASTTASPPVP